MSGKIPVRIVTAGDGTTQPVGVDFGRNHNFEVVTAADQRSAGHIPMTAAVAAALGISVSGSGPILDTYTGASFAYSPRLIRTGTTFCMRGRHQRQSVRRVCNDGGHFHCHAGYVRVRHFWRNDDQ